VAADYLEALIALGNAHVAHENFAKKRLAGVSIASLRPVTPAPHLGDPCDKQSPIRQLLSWAIETRRLEPEDITVEWDRPAA
jgi:hypothetical protein